MGTLAYLDVTRRELYDPVFTFSRQASEIQFPQGGKNHVVRWPLSRTITLAPINSTPSFAESAAWEDLKFRLVDCNYDTDWYTEVAENNLTGVGPCDYFIASKVTSSNTPALVTDKILYNHPDTVVSFPDLPSIRGAAGVSIGSIQGITSQPTNTGYCLRFYQEGRKTFSRGTLIIFYFGQFALRLNSNGTSELWQTFDYSTYGIVHSWQWADAAQVHGANHRVIIFPHARNKIELISSTALGVHAPLIETISRVIAGSRDATGTGFNSLYTIPGELLQDTLGNFIVTNSGQWAIRISREFRPYFQVSKLGFLNGTDGLSGFFDTPMAFDVPPMVDPFVAPHGDYNGGSAWWGLLNVYDQTPFVANGTNQQAQFAMYMRGQGDYSGGEASSATPEVYDYSIDKPATFTDIAGTNTPALSITQSMDRGDSPESERLNITLANSLGEMAEFERRGNIAIKLVDTDSGLTLFEGTSESTRSGQAPAQHGKIIEAECRGMVDVLLRKRWLRTVRNNFGRDPYDPAGRAWLIGAAIRRSFEVAGFDPAAQVIIEQESTYLQDFRLWLDGGSGGTRGGSAAVGGGHNQQAFNRWWPQTGTVINEFIDHLIRSVLGWNWVWDLSDHAWHIYKRPRPSEIAALPIKATFWGTETPVRALGANNYSHRVLAYDNKRPVCTTVIASAIIQDSHVETKAQLQQLIGGGGVIDKIGVIPSGADPQIAPGPREVYLSLDNPNGYASAQHSNPDTTSPDYMRQRSEIYVPLMMCATKDALEWMARRTYEDNCFGYVYANWNADWGDAYTYNLRKWDRVQLDTGAGGALEDWLIDRVEPDWQRDRTRRARYTATLARTDAPPPR